MDLSKRKKVILYSLIREYIESASPVSSQALEENYDFDVCSATIRREMHSLTKEGFLYQMHVSGGRIPTDKGYRFFVDNLISKIKKESKSVNEKRKEAKLKKLK
ncbi:MAG: heat-inducible transcription repressor HrcA, partial [Minisyncoccales bacterium]